MSANPEQVDWQEVGQQLGASMSAFVDGLNKTFAAVAEALKPTMDAVLKAAETISAALWQAYRDEGAIYGDTQEGLQRWMDEQMKINRLRAEADRLEQYHEGLRQFKINVATRHNEEKEV